MGEVTSRFVVWLLVSIVLVADSDGCDDTLRAPAFGEAATALSLEGVVESEPIAVNPTPWGRSVSAVTRVWGGVSVERLEVSQRRFVECPAHPFQATGTVRYRFVGLEIDGADDELTAVARVDDATLAALEADLGSAVTFEVSGLDRMMAVVQAWLWELAAGVVVAVGVTMMVVRSRRHRLDRRRYLF